MSSGNTIVYYSMTGNTKAFAERFKAEGYEVVSVEHAEPSEPFTLFTPTYNFGEVPQPVREFLDKYEGLLTGVVAFGNRNWGAKFAQAGDLIAEVCEVPLLRKVEMRGTDEDYEYVKERINWQK
ncbi:protein involved in ribonucleotide reduction [Oceanobacillus limi]|uniref:Protein involved in ribonucleotide reduction n=1 Tax=Oceanobacillus limi TaxID=930131 RepID=A0A1I0EC62_9BACI|nr:class Ib ribonucleoside-diphosphate reductase assembly flavoprotein NrdI [Oceanobacillus limi]SET42539.1 protein involved in ribonucleotide reduction [Oceanobacillus limi]